MGIYLKVWSIEDEYRSMFDTIAEVARLCKVSYDDVMHEIGFQRNYDIKALMINPPTNYFSIEYLLCSRLNKVLRSNNIPLRIVGKRRRYVWLQNS